MCKDNEAETLQTDSTWTINFHVVVLESLEHRKKCLHIEFRSRKVSRSSIVKFTSSRLPYCAERSSRDKIWRIEAHDMATVLGDLYYVDWTSLFFTLRSIESLWYVPWHVFSGNLSFTARVSRINLVGRSALPSVTIPANISGKTPFYSTCGSLSTLILHQRQYYLLLSDFFKKGLFFQLSW